MIDHVAPGLLGRHVIVLALDHADRGLLGLHRRLGDAKVDQLDLSGVGHQHVLRRDVAVHDAQWRTAHVLLAVRVVEPGGHLLGDEGTHVQWHLDVELGTLAQQVIEVGAVDELHRDVIGIADTSQVEGVRNVDVGQLHRDLGFVDEHLHELLVLGEVGMDHLERDVLFKAGDALGLGEMQLRHTADGDLTNQSIGAKLPLSHSRLLRTPLRDRSIIPASDRSTICRRHRDARTR